jgi:hypothetical protein
MSESVIEQRTRRYPLIGGPCDGKKLARFFPGDDSPAIPTLSIDVLLRDCHAVIHRAGTVDQIVYTGNCDCYATYRLYRREGRPDDDPIFRYLFGGTSTIPVPDIEIVNERELED